jgi:hypothetical protein
MRDFLFITALVIGGVLLAVMLGACGGGPRRCHGALGPGDGRGEFDPCAETRR